VKRVTSVNATFWELVRARSLPEIPAQCQYVPFGVSRCFSESFSRIIKRT